MKKTVSLLLSAALMVSLVACGGEKTKGETLTGSAQGYSSEVKVTLTREDGKITACTVDASGETETIGAKAAEELQNQVVAANGAAIDGVAGATITSKAVKAAVAAALGEEQVEETPKPVTTPEPKADVAIDGDIQLGLAYGAAHGTKCFSQAFAVVQGDTIVAAYIDEYQFMAGKGVPSSDAAFAEGYADPAKPLVSKRVNNTAYSANMASKGGSTVQLSTNYDIIQDFVVGKTIAEVEAVAGQDNAVDAVAGATLADTAGYLKLIADAAKNAQGEAAVAYKGSSKDLRLNEAFGAANGDRGFTVCAAVTAGDKILLTYIDEFQFQADAQGVPNSDVADGFAAGYADPATPIISKRVNNDSYSQMMASYAGSTISIADNWNALQNHINGMTIAEAEALVAQGDGAVDAVTGCTLVNTAKYADIILDAAKGGSGLRMGLAYGAAHGTKCFSQAYAVIQGDTIVAAHIDEFQFMAGEGVPNSDQAEGFAAGYADAEKPLVSKRVNNELYSKNMAEKGGATVKLADSYDAIQAFVVGKTIAEVEAAASQENILDAVSGSTLADTAGYLKLIASAAQAAQGNTAVEYAGDMSKLKLNVAYGAAHGTKCFTAAAALTDGENIVLCAIDDFQFMAGQGVPNSDVADGFAAGYADQAKPLVSKRVNADAYSENMSSKGGATVRIDDNFDALQNHVNGMTIADAKALAGSDNAVDAVTGCTLADTAGYVGVIVSAAEG